MKLIITTIFPFIYWLANSNIEFIGYKKSLLSKLYINLFPLQTQHQICSKLQDKLLNNNKYNIDKVSISVVNKYGNYIIDINGDIPRIPASNQKLISTAYSLDKLGPEFRFTTILTKTGHNNYQLFGTGDPDLNIENLKNIVDKIDLDLNNNNKINLTLFEEPKKYWWPRSWLLLDRSEIYGAPLTRLSIASNSSKYALVKPTENFRLILKNFLNLKNIKSSIKTNRAYNNSKISEDNSIYTIKSSPLLAYLTLSNSQSHNFTSEVLLRNALMNWDIENISEEVISWLRFIRVNTKNLYIADASGLSRSNRLTTNSISKLLKKMYHHRYSDYFYSSMSLYGIRGTLSEMNDNKILNGNFFGKTGTLNDVRALSGMLNVNATPLFISIIINDKFYNEGTIYKILSTISQDKQCYLKSI